MITPKIISPYNLIQEQLYAESAPFWDWRILVACMMLNQTTAKQVKPVMREFFKEYETPHAVRESDHNQLVEIIRPLGLYNRRSASIVCMSTQFADGELIGNLYGIGEYAYDSWIIFCERTIKHDVKDKELKNYVRWAKTQELT